MLKWPIVGASFLVAAAHVRACQALHNRSLSISVGKKRPIATPLYDISWDSGSRFLCQISEVSHRFLIRYCRKPPIEQPIEVNLFPLKFYTAAPQFWQFDET